MTTTELGVRVTVGTAVVIAVVALAAGQLAGPPAGIGVLIAGTLTILNFAWLARGAAGVIDRAATGSRRGGWALGFALRYVVLAMALGLLLVTGWAHPLAVVAGLTVLPCVLIAIGLGAGRSRTPSA